MSNKTPQQIIAEKKAAELAAELAASAKATKLPEDVITSNDATKTEASSVDTAALLAQLAAANAALAAKDAELEKVKAKLPVNDYITLRGSSPTFSVVIEGKRCLFVNFLFITRDRLLANKILAEFPNITEVKEDEQSIQHVMPEVSQVIYPSRCNRGN